MTDEELKALLRSSIVPPAEGGPRRDLWPDVAGRFDETARWSFIDVGLAAAVVVALAIFPEWLWLLAYHL